MVEEQGIETLELRGDEFDFFDTMRHVRMLPVEQQKAVEYLRLGYEDKELSKLGHASPAENRQAALRQLAYWSLAEDEENDS
jgi:hypothetical protein